MMKTLCSQSKILTIVVGSLTVGGAVFSLPNAVQAEPVVDIQVDYEGTAYFSDSAEDASGRVKKQRFNNSIATELEIYQSWDDDNQSVTFKPFFRVDEADSERTHGDIRELIYHMVSDEFEVKTGIGKVFWGVTESQHLVDIINQTDSVEQIDGEAKLGQPMVQVLLERDWGNLDFFLLPYHRERVFAGPDGRLSTGLTLADAIYQAEEKESHIDFAIRHSGYLDSLDYGISYFQGTSREPVLGAYIESDGSSKALPYYPLIKQFGLELQYLYEGWAWKFEGIYRSGMPKNTQSLFGGTGPAVYFSEEIANVQPEIGPLIADAEDYSATTVGFEYTQVGILDSRIDLGWVVEHLHDSRGDDASAGSAEHDVLLATRWAMNDAEDTEVLAGVLYDYEYEDYSFSIEGNTRLSDGLSAEIEARFFEPSEENSLYAFRNEDFVKFTLSYYY